MYQHIAVNIAPEDTFEDDNRIITRSRADHRFEHGGRWVAAWSLACIISRRITS